MENKTNGRVTVRTAVAIVVANMVGAGVFTSLGFQAANTTATFPILLLWVLGGIVALCGALCYGELASMFPRSGGEYNYLSEVYHPAVGFMSGWISATVGFAAPIAVACGALGKYAGQGILGADIPAQYIGLVVLWGITAIHATDIGLGSVFQQYSTFVKVLLIIGFVFGGFFMTPTEKVQSINLIPQESDWKMVFSAPFAVSLAFVSFAYSGWNASAYLANEIENPRKNVPLSLLVGTSLVMVAYIVLNCVFLYTLPAATYASEQAKDFGEPLEVGYLSAQVFLGNTGGQIMAGMIALLLISSISAMVFAGPRVTQMIGEDIPFLKQLAFTNKKGIPVYAIIGQSVIASILVIITKFSDLLYAIAFTLDIFTFATIFGVFVMRIKDPNRPRAYRTWGYPVTPVIFLAVTGWTMFYLLQEKTIPALVGLGFVFLGLVVYFVQKGSK